MDEKEKEQKSAENNGDRIQSKAISELDRADQIAERQKRENDRREALLIREEALAARRAVGGQTDAGVVAEKPKPLSNLEYAERALKGEFNKRKDE